MSNRAWMPLHIADYLADTGHLTATEHGAYLLLIMHYWQNGHLPENERVIARIAKLTPDQWEESRDMLAMLFGPGWTHKRIDAELSKADDIIEKRRAAAEARFSKGKKQTSDANACMCKASAHTRARYRQPLTYPLFVRIKLKKKRASAMSFRIGLSHGHQPPAMTMTMLSPPGTT